MFNKLILGTFFLSLSLVSCEDSNSFSGSKSSFPSGDNKSPESSENAEAANPSDNNSNSGRINNNHIREDASIDYACLVSPTILKAEQALNLEWKIPAGEEIDSFELSSEADDNSTPLGEINSLDNTKARYTAPNTIEESTKVFIDALVGNEKVRCQVMLQADGDIAVPDDGILVGIPGNVYQLSPDTVRVPNFDEITPVASIVMTNLDIPVRFFNQGFPGVRDLFEWFGIRFRGRIYIPEDGAYWFQLSSDDGSNFYIDDKLVVDNDGNHEMEESSGKANLTAGYHNITIDYYQGPRDFIGLQLFWKRDLFDSYSIIPAENFERPLN